MNAQLAENYLFVGPLVMARLTAQLVDLPVEGVEEMAQVVDAQDMRPEVAYVMWGGDRFDAAELARAGSSASQRLLQRWIVWLKVRNDSRSTLDARNSDAGRRLTQIHKALQGWEPEGALRKLYRIQGPAPDYQTTSGLYPLAFEINLVL